MKKITLPILVFLIHLMPERVLAQVQLGNVSGNYNTTQSMLLNPSQVYPDRNRVYIHWWSYGAEYNNNYLKFQKPFSLWNWTGSDLSLSDMEALGNSRDKYLNYLSTSQILSFAFRYSGNRAFGFSTRTVQGISVYGLNESLALLGRNGFDTSSLRAPGPGLAIGRDYQARSFSLNSDNYQEFSFTFGSSTRNDARHVLKTGITGKLLLGFGAAHASGKNIDYRFDSKDSLLMRSGSFSTGHTGEASVHNALNNPLGLWFNQVNGLGLGLDFGLTYEFKPNRAGMNNKYWLDCRNQTYRDYKLRLGASITDLGFINYYNGNMRTATLNNNYWRINPGLMADRFDVFSAAPDRFNTIDTGFTDRLGAGITRSDALTTFTPASFNAQFDYNFGKGWYLGAHWVQNLRSRTAVGLRKMSQIAVVPRYEREDVEIGMPVSLTGNYTRLTWGIYGRLGPFILGTDNLPGITAMAFNGKHSGASFYGGFRFKINPCPWVDRHEYVEPIVVDTIQEVPTDSLEIEDPVELIPTDTIKSADTIYIEKTLRDTIYLTGTASIKAKEAELKRREDELKRREAEILAREDNLKRGGGNCCIEAESLRNSLQQERNNNSRLQAQVNNLQRDNRLCDDRNREQQRTIGTLRDENSRLKADLNASRDENSRLKSEVSGLRIQRTTAPCDQQTRSLDSLLAAERNDKARISAELGKTRIERDNLSSELNALKSRVTDLEKQLNECRNNATISAEVNRLKKENDDLKARNAQIEGDLNKERGNNATVTAEVNRLKKESEEQKLRLAQIESELNKCRNEGGSSSINAEVNRLKKENDEIRNKNSQLESDLNKERGNNATITAEVNRLKKENDDQKVRLAQIESDLNKCKSEGGSSTLTAEVNRLKKENDDQKATIGKLESDLKKCGDEKSTITAEVNKVKKENSELKAQVASLETQVKNGGSCCSEVSELKFKNEQLENQIKAVQAEYKFVSDENKTLKSKITELESNLKKCNESNTGGSSELQTQVNQLKKENTDLQTKLNNLQTEYNKLNQQSAQQLARIKTLETDNEKNKKCCEDCASTGGNSDELNTLKLEYEQLRIQNNTNRDKARDLENEVKTLKGRISALEVQLDECNKKANGNGEGSAPAPDRGTQGSGGKVIDGVIRVLGNSGSSSSGGTPARTPQTTSPSSRPGGSQPTAKPGSQPSRPGTPAQTAPAGRPGNPTPAANPEQEKKPETPTAPQTPQRPPAPGNKRPPVSPPPADQPSGPGTPNPNGRLSDGRS